MRAALSDQELLSRLVSFDSTSCNSTVPILDFVCDYLDGCCASIERLETKAAGKQNLIARTHPGGGSPDRGGLILCGHVDVVPAVEPEWRSDPFELVESEDALFARGSCDMKGADALMINAFREAAIRKTDQPVVLLLLCDEEIGTIGAQHFAETWQDVDSLPADCLVGEPTSLEVVDMHKGHVKMHVSTRGVSAHSAYPHLGRNAIVPMARIVMELDRLAKELESERLPSSDAYPETPYPSLNIAQFHGGAALNIIPDAAELGIGIRLLPGSQIDELAQRTQEAVERGANGAEHTFSVEHSSPPLEACGETPLRAALMDETGATRTQAVSYASDAGPLASLGIRSLLCGPGSIEVAHKPNEFVPKAEFARAGEIYRNLVGRLCG